MTRLIPIRGTFVQIVVAGRESAVLSRPRPGDVGRYHGPGQAALYMSPCADWARVAVEAAMREDGLPRASIRLRVAEARVVDLRDPDACRAIAVERRHADGPWRAIALSGGRPPSWDVADRVRGAGAHGLIDPSKLLLGAWHLTLFAWNEPGAPQVTWDGEAIPFA